MTVDDGVLSDADIAAMSCAARLDLMRRLQLPRDDVFPPRVANRMRRTRLTLMVCGAVALIPWTLYLAFTLPSTYVAHNWPATWVGFDCMLVGFMAATAILGWLRRQLVLLAAFTTGILLLCDAWFDIITASPAQVWLSVLTAAVANLPIAVILISGALRILRLTATRHGLIDPDTPAWRLPLVP